METLTQEQLDQLLAARTAEEMRQIAESFGIDLDGPVSEWDIGAAPTMLSQIDEHYSFVKDNPDSDVLEQQAILDAATDPNSEGGEEVTPNEAKALNDENRPNFVDPNWVLDVDNRPLTSEEQQRVVEQVNFYHGGNFQSYSDLVDSGFLAEATAFNQQLIQAAMLDQEPVQTFSVRLANNDLFTVEQGEWASAQETYGVDSRQLTNIVRLADQSGFRGVDGEYIAWQPLAALMRATGLLDKSNAAAAAMEAAGDLPPELPGGQNPRRSAELGARNQLNDLVGTAAAPGIFDDVIGLGSTTPTSGSLINQLADRFATDPMQRYGKGGGTAQLSMDFNRGLELYNYDVGMAYIHALDPGLAARVKATRGDPLKMTGRDRAMIGRLVADGGFQDSGQFLTQLVDQGYGEADQSASMLNNFFSYLQYENEDGSGSGSGSGRGAGADPVRVKPDPVAVGQAVKDFYRALYFTDPDEATVSRFQGHLSSLIDAAEADESIDVSARLRQFAENDPLYQELYGNRPDGMSEEEYAAQFRQGQASMLGAETAGNQAVVAGLRTGDYQTTVGAAAGTEQAWDNSTFMGRLARAARSVNDYT